jgi:hypothetical protein
VICPADHYSIVIESPKESFLVIKTYFCVDVEINQTSAAKLLVSGWSTVLNVDAHQWKSPLNYAITFSPTVLKDSNKVHEEETSIEFGIQVSDWQYSYRIHHTTENSIESSYLIIYH